MLVAPYKLRVCFPYLDKTEFEELAGSPTDLLLSKTKWKKQMKDCGQPKNIMMLARNSKTSKKKINTSKNGLVNNANYYQACKMLSPYYVCKKYGMYLYDEDFRSLELLGQCISYVLKMLLNKSPYKKNIIFLEY